MTALKLVDENVIGLQGVSALDANDYFAHRRVEIGPLLPLRIASVLEVGCAQGETLGFLREHYGEQIYAVGVDGYEGAEAAIRKNADKAIIADVNKPLPGLGAFDLILALDILEHLEDPQAVLRRLVDDHLAPGGVVIVSLPAVSNFRVAAKLLFQRRWEYSDQGVMDRTHRWFFEERSSIQLMNRAGLSVRKGLLGGLHGRKARLINTLTLGLFKHWLAEQYIMRGVKAGGQDDTLWQVARYPKRG